MQSLSIATVIASEFLIFDNWCFDNGRATRLCLLHLQDYATDVKVSPDVKVAVRLNRLDPVVHMQSDPHSVPAG